MNLSWEVYSAAKKYWLEELVVYFLQQSYHREPWISKAYLKAVVS